MGGLQLRLRLWHLRQHLAEGSIGGVPRDEPLDMQGQGESAWRKAPSNSGPLKGFCRTATTFFVSSGSTA